VDNFEVYVCVNKTDTGGCNTKIGTTANGSTTTFTHINNSEPGKIYYYRIKAVQGESTSYFSSDGEGNAEPWLPPLSTPTNFSASDGTYEEYVELTWDSVTNAEWYTVYRCEG